MSEKFFYVIQIFKHCQFIKFVSVSRNVFFESKFVFKQNKTFNITWSFSDLILILMSNVDKNWNVRTKRKFSLFILNVVKEICLIKFAVTAWSMKIVIDDLRHDSIMWRIFLTIHITFIIFSSMSQYFVSASIKILLRNIINWFLFLMMIMSFFSKSF